MSGPIKLDIVTDELVDAASKASATAAGSALGPIATPPLTTTSQLDAALVLLSTTAETTRASLDARDNVWAIKQQTALTESPPVLAQQDQQGAADINGAATQIPKPPIATGAAGKLRIG